MVCGPLHQRLPEACQPVISVDITSPIWRLSCIMLFRGCLEEPRSRQVSFTHISSLDHFKLLNLLIESKFPKNWRWTNVLFCILLVALVRLILYILMSFFFSLTFHLYLKFEFKAVYFIQKYN